MLACSLAALQGVRSLSRFYLVLFMPVFFGPYWSWVAEATNFAFAFFFSILLQTAVSGLIVLAATAATLGAAWLRYLRAP